MFRSKQSAPKLMKLTAHLFITDTHLPFLSNTDGKTFAVPVAERVIEMPRAQANPVRDFPPMLRWQSGLTTRSASNSQKTLQPTFVERVHERRHSLSATSNPSCDVLYRYSFGCPLNGLQTISQPSVRLHSKSHGQHTMRNTALQLNRFRHGPSLD